MRLFWSRKCLNGGEVLAENVLSWAVLIENAIVPEI